MTQSFHCKNVKNYRPVTILSCLGKLFTSVLNMRLNHYLEETMRLAENQAVSSIFLQRLTPFGELAYGINFYSRISTAKY